MTTKEQLAFISQRIRNLVDSEPNDDCFLAAVWRLVRKAIELGGFATVEFTEFKAFFDVWRETETYTPRYQNFSGEQIGRTAAKLPHTMLSAMKWLAESGSVYGHRNHLPKFAEFESRWLISGRIVDHRVECPARETLRPFVEFLAMLIEGKRLSQRRRPLNGNAGRPRIEGKDEQRDLNLFEDWQTAKAAKTTAKDFCEDNGIKVPELNRIVDWAGKRRRRGQL